jgi:cathepsin D
MGGFTIQNQIFLSVDDISENIVDPPIAGLMGLAFTSIASTQAPPFWLAVANSTNSSNQLSSPDMSFWLSRNPKGRGTELAPGGLFTFGGTNTTLFSGEIEFLPLQLLKAFPTYSYWLLSLSTLTVNGKTVTKSVKALAAIDTGTTLIGGPEADVVALYDAIPGSQPNDNEIGFYDFPCSTNVSVTMNYGGKTWSIDPQDFNLGAIDSTLRLCTGAIFVLNQGSSVGSSSASPDWVVGDTFLKNVYSVFRSDPPSIGFAELSSAAGGTGTATGETSSTTSSQSSAMSTTIPGILMLSTAFAATIILCL